MTEEEAADLEILQMRLDVCQAIYDTYMMHDRKVAMFLSAVVIHTQQRCNSCPTDMHVNPEKPSIRLVWSQHNTSCEVSHNDVVTLLYAPEARTLQFSLRNGTLAHDVTEHIVQCINKEKAIHQELYETGG
jgi:hypothetical protein